MSTLLTRKTVYKKQLIMVLNGQQLVLGFLEGWNSTTFPSSTPCSSMGCNCCSSSDYTCCSSSGCTCWSSSGYTCCSSAGCTCCSSSGCTPCSSCPTSPTSTASTTTTPSLGSILGKLGRDSSFNPKNRVYSNRRTIIIWLITFFQSQLV